MIFGNGKPKLVYNGNTILLDNCTVDFVWQERTGEEQASVLTGHREWYELGNHAEFEIVVFLFKYANPSAKFTELYALRDKDVIFFPHRDGYPLRNDRGDEVLFHVVEMAPEYLKGIENYDVLRFRIKSKDFVKLQV